MYSPRGLRLLAGWPALPHCWPVLYPTSPSNKIRGGKAHKEVTTTAYSPELSRAINNRDHCTLILCTYNCVTTVRYPVLSLQQKEALYSHFSQPKWDIYLQCSQRLWTPFLHCNQKQGDFYLQCGQQQDTLYLRYTSINNRETCTYLHAINNKRLVLTSTL